MAHVTISRLDHGLRSSTSFVLAAPVRDGESIMIAIDGAALYVPKAEARRFSEALVSILAIPAESVPSDCGCEPGVCKQNRACPRLAAQS